ncbi:MAG: hypothetical protein RQM90_13965 [Methanoculleus sp.]
MRALAPVTPDIDPVLLRKYIAYAKRTCFPILSDGAREALISYYMRLRNLASGDKPVPVTARQLRGSGPPCGGKRPDATLKHHRYRGY